MPPLMDKENEFLWEPRICLKLSRKYPVTAEDIPVSIQSSQLFHPQGPQGRLLGCVCKVTKKRSWSKKKIFMKPDNDKWQTEELGKYWELEKNLRKWFMIVSKCKKKKREKQYYYEESRFILDRSVCPPSLNITSQQELQTFNQIKYQ